MRVLHLIKGLGPGGAERLLVSLTSARSTAVDVHVAYVLPHKNQLVGPLTAAGADVHLIGSRRGMADPRWLLRLRPLVSSTRADVVHIHSPALAAASIPLLRLGRKRPAIVTTEHNRWDSFSSLTRLANGLALPLADVRLAVSEEARASMWSLLRARAEVVVQGIPLDELTRRRSQRDVSRAELGLSPDEVLVVTIANFREKKDYPTLLAAAARANHPNLRFVSIGQGPLEQELRDLHGRLRLGERFRFLGYHPDPPSVLAAADVFTLTSRHEGLPIALLEAMALGVAPVVSAVGGIPEVVTNGADGVLLDPGDPEAFAVEYCRLADAADLRRRLGDRAAIRVRDFDIADTQRRLEAIYCSALGSQR